MKSFKIKYKVVSLFLTLAILLSFAALPAASVSAGASADLILSGVTAASDELYDNDKIVLAAIVRNASSSDVSGKFSVDFAIDGQFLQTVTFDGGIAAGKSVVVKTTFTYFLFGGSHKATAYVNMSKNIAESNYSNNILKERIDVSMDDNPNPESILPVEDDAISLPTAYTVQAENCTLLSGTVKANTIKGAKGNGYVLITKQTDGFYVAYNAAESGTYNFTFRYNTLTNNAAGLSYLKSDGVTASAQAFNREARQGSWVNKQIPISLKAGVNNIKFFVGENDRMNLAIDQIQIERAESNPVKSFSFTRANNPGLPSDIKCDISYGQITAYVPADLDVTDLVASYSTSSTVTVQGVEQKSGVTHNDFTNGHYYKFTDSNGKSVTYAVKFIRLSGGSIPNLYVSFGSDVSQSDLNTLKNSADFKDKEVVVGCSYTLTTNGKTYLPHSNSEELNELTDVSGTIKLRGNSTLSFPKKGYKIKFDKKHEVLDMEKSKSWVLMACYGDKSLLRDYMGFQLGQTLDRMGYASDMRYVNLFFDGQYKGLYLLGEGAKIGKGRLDITEITPESTDITGGYILEIDRRRHDAENVRFELDLFGKTLPFSISEPDEDVVTDKMRNYISGYIADFFSSLKDPTTHEYEKYIDVDSFVDWYIAMEIAKVNDSTGYSSVYLHKNAGGKLCMGPVWDFIPGFGATDYSGSLDDNGNIRPGSIADTTGYWVKDSLWWKYLFKDQKFVDRVKTRWQEMYADKFDGLTDKLDEAAQYIKNAADDNFKRWPILDRYIWAEPKVLYSREAYVNDYKDWLSKRIEWLNTQYGK